MFLLIIFGYAQGAYYITIWCSIVCMKCNGEDPIAHESDAEHEREEEERKEHEEFARRFGA